ncbi:hypothetical protein [Streptomyces sp. NPDC012888]|uniref:hypothetical protein n=1 Tax=Streptomyces sp. NPDC012888 TaxID=3364855 RepID=UPI0036BEBE45
MPYYRSGGGSAARLVALVTDVVCAIIVVWIVMALLGANRANEVVEWFHDAASWLAGWSVDIFSFDAEWARVVVGYGLAAVVYAVAGHALARALARPRA